MFCFWATSTAGLTLGSVLRLVLRLLWLGILYEVLQGLNAGSYSLYYVYALDISFLCVTRN